MYKYLFIIVLISLFSFKNITEDSSEILRQKIENISNKPLTALGETIYGFKSVSKFYQRRSFQIAWNTKDSEQLLIEIQNAVNEGLDPQNYHIEKLVQFSKKTQSTAFEKADYDLMLTDAFLLYTSHLLSGKVNPKTVDAEWHISKREGNPIELLEEGLASGIKKAINTAMPKNDVYFKLRKSLKSYRDINKKEAWEIIPAGNTIKQEVEDDRLPLIRERLFLLGDLKDKKTEKPKYYDDDLLIAVQNFQKRHGLTREGDIGAKTIAELNVTISDRIQQIEANMERWRWLQQEFGDYYIKVNIANFELDVVKEGKLVRNHKVIVGKPYRRTPVFSSKMQYLVLNPSWTVPPGILNNDVLPGVRKDASYLKKKKLTVLDNKGNPINVSEIDWNSKAIKSYTYRQPPGPENALGAVKFMFPNGFHVYLHDTPSKELFEKNERFFSSGCVRVHNPLSLAEFLLNDPVNWTKEKIDKVVATRETKTVQLKEQPNVHILYWTAWVDDNGLLNFRKDIYERDKPLIKELKEKSPEYIK